MSYSDLEGSRCAGEPVECFRFAQGGNLWLYTSADRTVALPQGVFIPEPIARTELDFSQEDAAASVDVTVPRVNPVAQLFVTNLPSTAITLVIYRAHRGSETASIVPFSGRVTRARFEESEAVLMGETLMGALGRSLPALVMQSPCNHVLYSDHCGANPLSSRDPITITTVNGPILVSADFALRADQWFRSGRLETAAGETRFIADHRGDTVTLISPIPGLASGDHVWAYWGCDHAETTCTAKFNNLVRHLGWSRIPGRNPFTGRID